MAKKNKYDVVCIGDVVMDAFITLEDKEARIEWDKAHEHPRISMSFADKIPYKSLTVAPAVGNASNVAVGASRLGLKTAIITAVGGDHYGTEIQNRYHKEGVSCEYVRVNKDKPTNYHFVLNYKAERTILIKHEKFEYYDPRKIDSNTGWIYFSSIAEHTLPFHKKVAEYLKKHPEIKMGFNPGTFQLRFGADKLREIYKHTYVLFVNREEAQFILHSKNEDIMPLFAGLHKLGPKVVVITDGPGGAYASDGADKYFMPSYPDPRPPISRTGAGDAFSTGFFCGLVYGLSIKDALRWAPIESMHVVQYFGAQTGLLSKPELLSLLKKAPKDYLPKKI
jgi:sugar/nucleoside kinase (ribokinase family)